MAKNGNDANEAAARALLRLGEAPASIPETPPAQEPTRCSATPTVGDADCAGGDEEAPDAVEESPARRMPAQFGEPFETTSSANVQPIVPRRPAASVEGRRKRPCAA